MSTWAFVRSGKAQCTSGQSLASLNVALAAAPTTGHTVIVYTAIGASVSEVSSVKDSNAVALTNFGKVESAANGGVDVQLWAYTVSGTPTATYTITFVNAGQTCSAVAQEFSGLQTSAGAPVLENGAAGTAVAVTQSVPNPSYTSNATNDLAIYYYGDNGESITCAVANSYTADPSSNFYNTDTNGDCYPTYKNSTSAAEANGVTVSGGTNGGEAGGIKLVFKAVAATAFVATPAMIVGQGSTPHGIMGVASPPTPTQAIRRGGFY